MNDQEIPKEIQGLLKLKKTEVQSEKNHKAQEQLVEGSLHKCEEPLVTNTQPTGKKVFTEYFEPRPNISAYDDDGIDTKENKKFVKDFEPRPNLTGYNDDKMSLNIGRNSEKPPVNNESEPMPNVWIYNDGEVGYKGEKPLVNSEFEPRPSASKYND